MKIILLSTFFLCVCGLADEESNRFSSQKSEQDLKLEALHSDIHLVVVPTTIRITKGDEVDLDVYVINNSLQPIDCPPSTDIDDDGYSDASHTIYSTYLGFEGEELKKFGGGDNAHLLMDRPQSTIARRMSKHYKFRWKCPLENFDVITLDVELFIAGRLRKGTVTFLPKHQSGPRE